MGIDVPLGLLLSGLTGGKAYYSCATGNSHKNGIIGCRLLADDGR
jgi:hypothetical protein